MSRRSHKRPPNPYLHQVKRDQQHRNNKSLVKELWLELVILSTLLTIIGSTISIIGYSWGALVISGFAFLVAWRASIKITRMPQNATSTSLMRGMMLLAGCCYAGGGVEIYRYLDIPDRASMAKESISFQHGEGTNEAAVSSFQLNFIASIPGEINCSPTSSTSNIKRQAHAVKIERSRDAVVTEVHSSAEQSEIYQTSEPRAQVATDSHTDASPNAPQTTITHTTTISSTATARPQTTTTPSSSRPPTHGAMESGPLSSYSTTQTITTTTTASSSTSPRTRTAKTPRSAHAPQPAHTIARPGAKPSGNLTTTTGGTPFPREEGSS